MCGVIVPRDCNEPCVGTVAVERPPGAVLRVGARNEEEFRMTYRREVEVTETAPPVVVDRRPDYRPSALGVVERWIIFVFGLIQLVIGLRIILLLVAARQGNDI